MPLIAIVELHIDVTKADDAKTAIREMLSETRSFDGCERVDVLVDQDDPGHLRLYEVWETKEHNAAYSQWRRGPGRSTSLGPLLTTTPASAKFAVDDSI